MKAKVKDLKPAARQLCQCTALINENYEYFQWKHKNKQDTLTAHHKQVSNSCKLSKLKNTKNTLRKIWTKFSRQDSRFGNGWLLGNRSCRYRHGRIGQVGWFSHGSHVCRPVGEENASRVRQQVLRTCNLRGETIHHIVAFFSHFCRNYVILN